MKTRQLQLTSHSLAVVLAAAVRVALEVRIQQTLDKNVEAGRMLLLGRLC